MISIKQVNEHLVIQNTELVLDQMLKGLAEGIDNVSMLMARHAADNHIRYTDADRRAGVPPPPRERNPDGTYRWFSRTRKAVGSIRPMEAEVVGDQVEGGFEGGGPTAEYLIHLEYGTWHRAGRSGGQVGRMPAYPCFRPAGDAVAPKAPDIIKRSLESRVKV